MFFIIDIIPMNHLVMKLSGMCETCKIEGEIELIRTCQALRVFFIPVFKWHNRYYLKHSCGGKVEISEEVALGMQYGKVPLDGFHMSHKPNANVCKVCGKILEHGFEYCPYCGEKRL